MKRFKRLGLVVAISARLIAEKAWAHRRDAVDRRPTLLNGCVSIVSLRQALTIADIEFHGEIARITRADDY